MNFQADAGGHYGPYGGRYVPETLMPALIELEESFSSAMRDRAFVEEWENLLASYVGRPSPLYFAKRLSRIYGGSKIYLKREDLNHTGAHKINNALGQGLLARRIGKSRLIAETGAGQHGVATATVAALFGMECEVFMGEEDMRRQAPNVKRMELLGARLRPVGSGTRTLKDALNEALREWVATVDSTFYVIGSVTGPHPYPKMVRRFQSVIGTEARRQILTANGSLPDLIIACVGEGATPPGYSLRSWRMMSSSLESRRREKGSRQGNTRPALGPGRRVSSTGANPMCFRTNTDRFGRPIPFRPGWIIRASGPNTRSGRTRAGSNTAAWATRRPSRLFMT